MLVLMQNQLFVSKSHYFTNFIRLKLNLFRQTCHAGLNTNQSTIVAKITSKAAVSEEKFQKVNRLVCLLLSYKINYI